MLLVECSVGRVGHWSSALQIIELYFNNVPDADFGVRRILPPWENVSDEIPPTPSPSKITPDILSTPGNFLQI